MTQTASKGRRLVTVVIPDRDNAETTIRYAADRLHNGTEILVLDRPAVIPEAWMQEMANELQDRINEIAHAARRQIESSVTATLTSTRRT